MLVDRPKAMTYEATYPKQSKDASSWRVTHLIHPCHKRTYGDCTMPCKPRRHWDAIRSRFFQLFLRRGSLGSVFLSNLEYAVSVSFIWQPTHSIQNPLFLTDSESKGGKSLSIHLIMRVMKKRWNFITRINWSCSPHWKLCDHLQCIDIWTFTWKSQTTDTGWAIGIWQILKLC